MNKMHYIKSAIGLSVSILFLAGCKKDFLVKPPTDAVVDANFYKTDEQVLAGTNLLYSKVWFDYNDKASYNLGDFRSGTAFSAYNDRGNVLFNTTDLTPENDAAWRSFFNVVGQSNLAIANINRYAGPAVSENVKKIAIAEARFMRALAYRYLTMNWGEVPIIENNLDLLDDPSVTSKHTVKSIWRFITREMRSVAEDLPEVPVQVGRISKWSAEGMLARFYLTRAGVESTGPGARNQVFLDSAKYFAQRVINNSGRTLLTDYAALFKYPYDNNAESLFELQWVALNGDAGYGVGNSAPSYLNYSPDISVEGWGGDKAATWWMLSQYQGITASGDTMLQGRTLDQRLKSTFMLPGANYPEITQRLNGANQKLVFPYVNGDVNFASIKKYVVGKSEDLGFIVQAQRYPNNTYMMRLAELYLIYAEATLGNSASTNDATAMEYFNKVHTRAGLSPLADPVTGTPLPITLNDIIKERFIEFAMESMGWYDLVSLHYYDPAKAYSILNSQDRGLYKVIPDVFPNPTSWTFKKTPWATTERTINANATNFILPIPAKEKSQAPYLANPAVEYP
jgi:starch-binding outer membrane protein, SusD/RagB family